MNKEHYRERLIVELQSHLADALEKIHKMSAQKETREAVIESIKGDVIKLTSKVDEFRSIMASIRDERDQAVAQVAIQDQAMLRMSAALAELLPMHPNEPRSEHQSCGEAITMHAIVLTDAEWAALKKAFESALNAKNYNLLGETVVKAMNPDLYFILKGA